MIFEGYTELGHCRTIADCNLCGKNKEDIFYQYEPENGSATINVCSACNSTAKKMQKIRIKIKPIDDMDEQELLEELNDLLGTKYQWANIPEAELRRLVHAIKCGIFKAVQETMDDRQYDTNENDLGQVSGEAFIIRWKQASKHLSKMPDQIKRPVANAIIRDLGGIPPGQ